MKILHQVSWKKASGRKICVSAAAGAEELDAAQGADEGRGEALLVAEGSRVDLSRVEQDAAGGEVGPALAPRDARGPLRRTGSVHVTLETRALDADIP